MEGPTLTFLHGAVMFSQYQFLKKLLPGVPLISWLFLALSPSQTRLLHVLCLEWNHLPCGVYIKSS